MNRTANPGMHADGEQEFFTSILPRIKLAIGEAIDRDNAKQVPARYRNKLGDTLLEIVLHPTIVSTIVDLVNEVEADLSESSTRHGLMYHRKYPVRLVASGDHEGALFEVIVRVAPSATSPSEVPQGSESTILAIDPPAGVTEAEAARTESEGAPATEAEEDDSWRSGRWELRVVDRKGEEVARTPLQQPVIAIGRQPDPYPSGSSLRLPERLSTVSRRQLVVQWDPDIGSPSFRIFNTGKSPIRVGDIVIPGANEGNSLPDLTRLQDDHSVKVAPGVQVEIGTAGPILWIEDLA